MSQEKSKGSQLAAAKNFLAASRTIRLPPAPAPDLIVI
jgi:hypothetical protein